MLISLVGRQKAADVPELGRKLSAQICVVLEENPHPLQLRDGLEETHGSNHYA